MAQRTIAHMYDRYEDAETVVTDLEAAGIPHGDISLVGNSDKSGTGTSTGTGVGTGTGIGTSTAAGETHSGTGAGTGATLGTVVGGGLGLLAGIGSLAIPGVGPVVAAGWLVATLTGAGIGAAGGGLVGSLTGAGVSHDEAHVYAEGVRSGSSLVSVKVDDADAARVEEIMGQRGPVDWRERRASYGSDWKGFDEAASPRVRDYPNNNSSSGAEPSSGPASSLGTDPSRRT